MRGTILVLAGLLLATEAHPSESYSGQWEYRALNAGDTDFQVKQQGERITFYRVLYPEFEGQRFKLEHLYRGRLSGRTIHGELWVREEGTPDFERLRPFEGQILDRNRMRMDDMPLRRIQPPGGSRPAAGSQAAGSRITRVVISDRARDRIPAARTPAAGAAKAAEQDHPAPADRDRPAAGGSSAGQAPAEIPELLPVARRLAETDRRRADELLGQGDEAYGRKQYARAVDRYQAAYRLDPRRVELLYKLGLGHGILGSMALRAGQRRSAADHYRQAIEHWEKAVRLDPYNRDAKENIRRARAKLSALGSGL